MSETNENKYEELGYKINNTVTYAEARVATTILSTSIVTAASNIRVTTTGMNFPINISGLTLRADVRGFSLGFDGSLLSVQERRISKQHSYNEISDNFVFNKIKNNIVENTYDTTFRKNTINLQSISSTYETIPQNSNFPSFHKFKQTPSLSKHMEVNVCKASMFSFVKAQGLEFHYKKMANNQSWIEGYGAKDMTVGEYLAAGKDSRAEWETILSDKAREAINIRNPNENELKVKITPDKNATNSPSWFNGAWKTNTGETKWVKFPDKTELEAYLGEEQAKLLLESGEYLYNQPFIDALQNSSKIIVDQVNQAIPGDNGPIELASPLEATPVDFEYNKLHGGLVNIQLNRGKQQRYIFSQATGRTWIIGSNHLYYSGPRRVVHLDEHSELAETYKLMVKSGANYHFACRGKLEKNKFNDKTERDESASSVNYRYEGDFNMEMVSVTTRAEGSTAGKLEKYISGIHSTKKGNISVRADIVSLSSVASGEYSEFRNKKEKRSSIELNIKGAFVTGDVITVSSANKCSFTVRKKERLSLDESAVTIAAGTKFKASDVEVKGSSRVSGTWNFV